MSSRHDPADLYCRLARLGIDHGPRFRVLGDLFARPGEVLAGYARDDPGIGLEAHSVVIEGALQAGIALLGAEEPHHLLLPALIEGARLWDEPPREGWIWARLRGATPDEAYWDAAILDMDGAITVELDGCWVQRAHIGPETSTRQYRTVLRSARPVAPGDHYPCLPDPEHVRAAASPEIDGVMSDWTRYEPFTAAFQEMHGRFVARALEALMPDVRALFHHWPSDRPLRILEVGAGTGSTTVEILPLLDPELSCYLFTDISSAFFPRAQQRLAAFDFVEYQSFDIESDPAGQGIEGPFDIVIAANVLHATTNVADTLQRIAALIDSGGYLVAAEIHDQLTAALAFGLLDSFWRYTDEDRRTISPYLYREAWVSLLRDAGFPDIAVAGGRDASSSIGSVFLARLGPSGSHDGHPGTGDSESVAAPVLPAVPRRWIVISELEGDFADRVSRGLRATSRVDRAVPSAEEDRWREIMEDRDVPPAIVCALRYHL
jgi:SAM-dependent methyltransferase